MKKNLSILIVSQYFEPEIGAGSNRISNLAHHFVQEGHKVTVICESPNYPTGVIYPGFKNRLVSIEVFNGTRVIRTYVANSDRMGFVKQMLFYLSFMFSSVLGSFFAHDTDIVIATSPPLLVGLAGWIVSRLKGCPFIFDVRDLWPEKPIKLGELKNRLAITLALSLEHFLYQNAKKLVVVTEGYKKTILSDRPNLAAKIRVVTNGADTSLFSPQAKDPRLVRAYNLEHKFVVVYVGTLSVTHGILSLVETADFLSQHRDIVFLIVGDGVMKENAVNFAKEKGLENVIFLDSQPKNEVPRYLNLADVTALPLIKNDGLKTTIAAKTFEYMACGKPTILAAEGISADLLESASAGIVVEPENPPHFASAIMALYNDRDLAKKLGANARKFLEAHHSSSRVASQFINVVREIC